MIKVGRYMFMRDLPTKEQQEACSWLVLPGDAVQRLKDVPKGLVRLWLTSPPYYQQVDYGADGQYGQESDLDAYIANMVSVVNVARFCSTPDANLIWVVKDSYNGSGGAGGDFSENGRMRMKQRGAQLKDWPKKAQLLVPEKTRIAFAKVGWHPVLDIVWDKQDPRRGAKDRPSYAHEHVLIFSASPNHYWDREAVLQEYSAASRMQLTQEYGGIGQDDYASTGQEDPSDAKRRMVESMKKRPGALLRSVLQIPSVRQPTIEVDGKKLRAIAAFPQLLAEIFVNLASAPGDVVGDPFAGFGTTLVAAHKWGRHAFGVEINLDFVKAIEKRMLLEFGCEQWPENNSEKVANFLD